MNTITHTVLNVTNTFEIVDFVPLGYQIWNIGKNAPDGYLPLCRLKSNQPFNQSFDSGMEIETETLKAIRIDGAEIILAAIGDGQNTIELMERYIKRYRNAKPGTYSYRQVKRMEKAIPIMKSIKWN